MASSPLLSLAARHSAAFPTRFLSTYADPSRYVEGVTNEDLANDPVLAAFFEANFPTDEPPLKGKSIGEKKVDVSLNIRELSCLLRDAKREEGSRTCQHLRSQRFIPGLVYGSNPQLGIFSHESSSQIFIKTPWTLLQRELDLYHRNFESRVYDLTIYENEDDTEGTVHRVLPRDVQRHPVQSTVFCTNFLRYFPGRPIKIPIVNINEEESPALKRGGFLAPISRHVECVVEDGVPIPEKLELECTGLRIKEVVRLERIVFPDGVKPSKNVKVDQFLVGTVFGRRMMDEEDEEEGKEAEGKGGGEE
jgi:large subunit ribosomal protein L25